MMIMERKVFKEVDHQVDLDLIYLICSVEKDQLDQKKGNQN